MKIESLKELDKLMQLCRKRGVSSITVDGVTFHMNEKAQYVTKHVTAAPDYSNDFPEASIPVPKFTGEITDPEAPETTELTPEQLMMWSAGATNNVGQ